jgi:site-specific DNA recombinase
VDASEHSASAAIYLRQSLDATGDRLAVDRQREDCRRIVEQRGWQLAGEYVDNSISASDSKKNRPGYNALVEAYKAGGFDALVCWDLDRLTRQPRQLEDWIDYATDRGLILVTANGEADLSTDGGRMFARIKASVARAEIERKAARQRRAALQRSEHGKPPQGVRLTGYTTKGEIVESEAESVREIFARFAAGDSLRGLAQYLHDAGVPTRHGGQWSQKSVRNILTNPRYAGRAIYQGQPTGKNGTWKPLVEPTEFDLVQARLSDPRRRTQVGTDRKHLGSGLYRCSVCGARVRAWSGNRYRCPNVCISRTQEPVDGFVRAVIRARLARPDLADLLAVEEDAETRKLAADIAQLRRRLIKIEDDYDADLIDGRRFATATEKVNAALATAEAALTRSNANVGIKLLLHNTDPVTAFGAAPLMLQRSAIAALMTVSLLPAPRGRKTFDPETVKINWKTFG